MTTPSVCGAKDQIQGFADAWSPALCDIPSPIFCLFYKNKAFTFTEKLSIKYRDFPDALDNPTPTCIGSLYQDPHQEDVFV